MSKNILVFRTDRIGDLILTCPTIISIKKYFTNSKISIVTSEKNFNYAKKLGIFENVYLYPQNNFLSKIKLIYMLSKQIFDYIYIFDGKERSLIISSFIKCKNKLALSTKNKSFYKFFGIKIFIDDEQEPLNKIFQKIVCYSSIDFKINNYKFLNKKLDNKFSLNIPIKNYTHLHLDEKWIHNLYIKNYTRIDPTFDELITFLKLLSNNNNLLVTTGAVDFDLLNLLINNFFKKIDKNIFIKNCENSDIYFIHKPTFEDIESLLRNTKTLISCHGAITHAANSFNVKSIDIIEEKKTIFYNRFTSYLSNYNFVFRSNFSVLSRDLLKLVDK